MFHHVSCYLLLLGDLPRVELGFLGLEGLLIFGLGMKLGRLIAFTYRVSDGTSEIPVVGNSSFGPSFGDNFTGACF